MGRILLTPKLISFYLLSYVRAEVVGKMRIWQNMWVNDRRWDVQQDMIPFSVSGGTGVRRSSRSWYLALHMPH